jgi:hypothetical protein
MCTSTTPLNTVNPHFNARNIKGENSGQKPKMVYTPSATAQSEMTGKIVSIRQSHLTNNLHKQLI